MNSRRDLSRVRLKVQACLLLVRRFYLGPEYSWSDVIVGFLGLGNWMVFCWCGFVNGRFLSGRRPSFFFLYVSPIYLPSLY